MDLIPQMASISDLRNHHRQVFGRLADGPVVIASRNQPAAILVAPDQWNDLVEELDDLRAAQRAIEILEKADDDPDTFVPWEEARAGLVEDGLLDE